MPSANEVDRKEEGSERVRKLPERLLWVRVENNCSRVGSEN